MKNTQSLTDYAENTIGLGDNASEQFQEVCKAANRKTSVARFFTEEGGYELKTGVAAKQSIDGVGTKVQIYTTAFEGIYNDDYQAPHFGSFFSAKAYFINIWERMFHDLIAMNTDDLRNGEMAVAITDIIDVNHLKGDRGKVFVESMSEAMKNVIEELDIMITAGETAILGEPKKVGLIIEAIDDILNSIQKKHIVGTLASPFLGMVRKGFKQSLTKILPMIEFNIAGTSLGISDGKNKLSPLRPGQAVVGLQERPEDGIIGPRSNGITAIRDYMTELAGSNWENLSFEAFLEIIGDKASSIPDEIRIVCRGKKMWDIATGKSTVFNPFISRTLLGGVDGEKQVNLSSIIHVTGNPGKKTVEGALGVDMDLDISEMPVPTIIAILQHTLGIDGKEAMKGWNMGLPYALICDEDQVEEVIRLAKKDGIIARRIGTTKEKSPEGSTIKGVGVDNEEIPLAA